MPKDAFLFDLEGVLLDHLPRQTEIATKALSSVGVSLKVTRDIYQLRSEDAFHVTKDFLSGLYAIHKFKLKLSDVKENPNRIQSYVSRLDNLDKEKIATAITNFDHLRTSGEGIKALTPQLRRVTAMLKFLHKKGHPVYLVTAGKKVDVDRFMKQAGIYDFFAGYSYYGEDKIKKGPLFKQALEEHGLKPNRTWVVEDSLSGIKEAHELKTPLRTIGVLTGNTSYARFLSMVKRQEVPPTRILKRASQIRGHVVPTPAGYALRTAGRAMQWMGGPVQTFGTRLRNRYARKPRQVQRR